MVKKMLKTIKYQIWGPSDFIAKTILPMTNMKKIFTYYFCHSIRQKIDISNFPMCSLHKPINKDIFLSITHIAVSSLKKLHRTNVHTCVSVHWKK